MTPRRPDTALFDVLDTLFPLAPLEWRFREAGIPRVLMARWSDHLLRDVFALALTGGTRSFEDAVRGALRDITGHQIAPYAEDSVVEGLSELDPRPEAAAALRAAREGGSRVAVLGTTDAGTARRLLERSGLLEQVEEVLAPSGWKPAPGAYLSAAAALGSPPERVALVTAHGWDAAGASGAGLLSGWSSHLEGRFPLLFGRPDACGRDLAETVSALLTPRAVSLTPPRSCRTRGGPGRPPPGT